MHESSVIFFRCLALFILFIVISQIIVWIVKSAPAVFNDDSHEEYLAEVHPEVQQVPHYFGPNSGGPPPPFIEKQEPVQQQAPSFEPFEKVVESANLCEEKKYKCTKGTQTEGASEVPSNASNQREEFEYQESSVFTFEHRMERSLSFVMDQGKVDGCEPPN